MSKQREVNNPFYLEKRRAMVSLGPLNDTQHCPHSCAFCYVQDEFVSYANLDANQIVDFLNNNRLQYEIIYVSGDTDSFAPPRTMKGLDLLYKIVTEIDCDLLFTTRTTFLKEHYQKLKQIVAIQKEKNKMLYACISISRFSENCAYLEPNPIPSPQDRINTLKMLKEIGCISVLAMRPFLPVVNIDDYIKILERAKSFVDIVLGETFWFIRGGTVEKRVFLSGILPEYEKDIVKKKMRFDNNNAIWDVWKATEYEKQIKAKCKEHNIIFSMHSDKAIAKFKKLNK